MLSLLVAASVFSTAANHAAADTPTSVVLGSGSFQIPFNIAAGGVQPREVHLYMATADRVDDRNLDPNFDRSDSQAGLDPAAQSWKLLDRQSPSVGSFQVSQTPDGTFWFATRTIDASGRPHPPGPIQPELKVIVDTTEPDVDLMADADADGRVSGSFSVQDVTGISQVTVHYVTDTLQQWQTARVDRLDEGGRFLLEPTDQWHLLSIRLRVLDGAGNETIVKKRVQRPRVAAANSTRLASGPLGFGHSPSFGGGPTLGGGPSIAGNSATLPPPSTADQISQDFGRSAPAIEMLPDSLASGPEWLPAPPALPQPKTPTEAMRPLSTPPDVEPTPPITPPNSVPQNFTPQSNTPGNASPKNKSAANPADDALPQTSFQTETIPAPSGQPPLPTQLNRPALPDVTETSSSDSPVPSPWSPLDPARTRNPSREFSTAPSPRPVSPGELAPAIDNAVPREQRRTPIPSADPLDLERLAQRAVIRHSNSNQFSLDYEIEAIGGRGVEAIELYGTTDGGQTWKQWGSDPDKASPFDIETNGEGIFGFQIVVVAANGLASPRPLAGDAPDIVVVVDETAPVVGISGAKYGEADRAGSLVIAYHCEDRYLVTRPITLAFSDSPTGPWTTIAAGLRNTGDYVWPADPQLPRQIFLRIDATDQAGNVGGYVLEEPIDTRGLAPRARIRAFRAIPAR